MSRPVRGTLDLCRFRDNAMTESEWLKAADPRPMLEHLRVACGVTRRKGGRRKFRLFACNCLRDVWHLLDDERSRHAVEVAERYCDNLATAEALETAADSAQRVLNRSFSNWQAAEAANHVCRTRFDSGNHSSVVHAAISAATAWARDRPASTKRPKPGKQRDAKLAEHANWLRDIFGNPFRPVTFSPEWRTDTAIALARTMYDSREFSAMPILADALQDAGCDIDDVLNHCRDAEQVHVRGCWVVDLVLEKE